MKRFAGPGVLLVSWATKTKSIWNGCVSALFPANLLLSQNSNISLRGLRKSARRHSCAILRVHGAALDIKI
jgi:hypothetical protein